MLLLVSAELAAASEGGCSQALCATDITNDMYRRRSPFSKVGVAADSLSHTAPCRAAGTSSTYQIDKSKQYVSRNPHIVKYCRLKLGARRVCVPRCEVCIPPTP